MSVSDLCRDYHLPWLGADGKSKMGDVALGSRIRLARNFSRLPFPNRANMKELAGVQNRAASVFSDVESAVGQEFDVVGIEGLTPLERDVLVEKQLISRNLVKQPQYRSAYIAADRSSSIMVNEEDHLRIQCMAPGLDLARPYAVASKIDDTIESRLDIAFDEKMGYLTSCPTNLGTGLRATVIVHLPGLVYTRNMQSIINISQQLGLSVRGLYGEGSETVGNIFSISNQMTLGFTEEGLIDNLTSAVTEIVEHERRARNALIMYSKDRIEDAVWRAYGILRYARSLGEGETLELISKVRLGIDSGLLTGPRPETFSELLIASRPSFLKNLAGNENLAGTELSHERAAVVRKVLTDTSN